MKTVSHAVVVFISLFLISCAGTRFSSRPSVALSAGTLIPTFDLALDPERKSIHLGETLKCRVQLTEVGCKRLTKQGLSIPWRKGESIMDIPFKPTTVGTQVVGPIELKLAGLLFRSDSLPVTVLPGLSTNDLREVRILERKGKVGQPIEVFFQWQKFTRLKLPALEPTFPSENPTPERRNQHVGWGHTGHWLIRTDDWEVERGGLGSTFSDIRRDADGAYQLEGGLRVYTLYAVRPGQLPFTLDVVKQISRSDPGIPVWDFEPLTIDVEKGVENLSDDAQ